MFLHLKYGISPITAPVAFGWGGWSFSFLFKDSLGYEFTLLSKRLYEKAKEQNYTFNHSAVELSLFLGSLYGTTLRISIAHLEEGYKYGMLNGECLFGPYCTYSWGFVLTANGIEYSKSIVKLRKIIEV